MHLGCYCTLFLSLWAKKMAFHAINIFASLYVTHCNKGKKKSKQFFQADVSSKTQTNEFEITTRER